MVFCIACALKYLASSSALGMFGSTRSFNLLPMVIERAPFEQGMDIRSLLLQTRKVFLQGPITNKSATSLIAQMLYLDSLNQRECTQM
jgi:ATP-dependent protease ClpP protease subunit